jgi:hypothetical protein
MLVRFLPSVRLISRPSLFTPVALSTLPAVLTIALVLSEERSYSCVWGDAGARCTFPRSRTAAPSRSTRGADKGSGLSGRSVVRVPNKSEERIVDLSK